MRALMTEAKAMIAAATVETTVATTETKEALLRSHVKSQSTKVSKLAVAKEAARTYLAHSASSSLPSQPVALTHQRLFRFLLARLVFLLARVVVRGGFRRLFLSVLAHVQYEKYYFDVAELSGIQSSESDGLGVSERNVFA